MSLYVAAGGIHPQKVLPIMFDVGTDNEAIRSDPLYLGLNMPRLKGNIPVRIAKIFLTEVVIGHFLLFT